MCLCSHHTIIHIGTLSYVSSRASFEYFLPILSRKVLIPQFSFWRGQPHGNFGTSSFLSRAVAIVVLNSLKSDPPVSFVKMCHSSRDSNTGHINMYQGQRLWPLGHPDRQPTTAYWSITLLLHVCVFSRTLITVQLCLCCTVKNTSVQWLHQPFLSKWFYFHYTFNSNK